MRIAQVAPPWTKVPPEKYGGIELVVWNITEELVKKGHDVTLFASGDSESSVCEIVSVCPEALFKKGVSWEENHNCTLLLLEEVFRRADEFDIIHLHVGSLGSIFASFTPTPVVHTIHTNIHTYKKGDGRLFVYERHRDDNYVSISNAQQKNSMVKLNFVANVYNGISAQHYRFNPSPEDKFIWIANFDEIKGADIAVNVADKLGIRLDLAGKIHPEQKEFFKKKIKPRLNDRIRYVGEISQSQKSNFFGSAKAFIYPLRFDEPFGLVMVEAMACGTPVIAFPRGSTRELIKNGVSGFAVRTFKEMCEAVLKIDSINRVDIRQWFLDNFTAEKMVDQYEEVYEQVIRNNFKTI